MINLNSLDLDCLENEESYEIEKVNSKDIAIIGISTYLPMADNVEEFWQNLKSNTDCITNFPLSRKKDMDKYIDFLNLGEEAKTYNLGGYLEDIDKFDYRFFQISPKEASLIDPNQRLFLQNVWKTVQDAGYEGDKIRGTRTGIYIGYNADTIYDYKKMINEISPELGSMAVAGNLTSVLGGRISYLLDLRGPSMTIDTACSSSLTAVHIACQSIKSGDCDMAIVGSVKTNILPMEKEMKLGIESSDNRTRPFDDRSDGTAMGEGVATVLLKPLSKAMEDRDNIYAVIKGSAINQDGNSIGLTAPNAVAQEDVIVKAWEDAGVEPESISYIEAHGTGTELGDPIEIDGIQRAFRRYTDKKQFCGIGSVKSNIGHLDNAAGIVSVIKSALALKHKEIPASTNFKVPNNKINFEESPVYVNDKLKKWEAEGYPRRCGISAFGLSGTNCHVVLEEAPDLEIEDLRKNNIPRVLTISAKSKNTFKELINNYKKYLDNKSQISLSDLCYTSNIGREHHNIRMALIVNDIKDLKEKLNIIKYEELKENNSQYESKDIYFANCKVNMTNQDKQEDNFDKNTEDIANICKAYTKGENINWLNLHKNEDRKTISIPIYPFERSRCWLDIPEGISLGQNYSIVDGLKISKQVMKEIDLAGKENGKYSETENKLAQIWGNILGFNELNINDNFYQLGGDSIIAMKIANSINSKLDIKLEIGEILQNQTISELAICLENKYKESESNIELDKANKYDEIKPLEQQPYYEVSSAQKRLYILNEMEGIGTTYNIPGYVEVEGNIDKDRLNKAFKKLIDRHESLRTSFEIIEEEPVQIISDSIDFEIEMINLDEENSECIERSLDSFIKPFDLSKAPLFRVGLIKIKEEKHILIVDMHHIISDGSSMGIIIKELMELYRGNQPNELRVQYKDFCSWQNRLLKLDDMEKQEKYWISQFKGEIPVLELPIDYKRPPIQSFEGNKISIKIDEILSQKLRRIARETGTTLYMVLLAAYNVLLSKYSRQEDIVVGSLISGRNNIDLENMVGMFVNTLALRNYPNGNKCFHEFLNEVKTSTLQAYDNQDFQFEELINKLDIVRDYSRNPLFDTLFVMQNMNIPQIKIDDLSIKPYEFDENRTRFDLSLQAIESKEDDSIEFIFEYCTKLFKKETINNLANHLTNILSEISNNYKMKISEIDILSENELDKILVEFNNSSTEYPKNKTIHQLFEENVERNPNNKAVIFDDQSITYKKLNEKSNQLAKLLRQKGVKRDKIVGLMVDRSIEMMIGVMAILKAGGAYLPINPNLPDSRVKYMLEDSGTNILLTHDYLAEKMTFENGEVFILENKDLYQGETSNLDIEKELSRQLKEVDSESIKESNKCAENAAYVIYTSGSTGKPKGVMVEHKALNNFLHTMNDRFDRQLSMEDNYLSLTNISFDVGVGEIFLPLVFGGTLVLFNNDKVLDIRKLAKDIVDKGITYAYIPPTILTDVFNLLKEQKDKVKLNKILVGVEPIKDYVLENYLTLNEDMKIINGYGPTETTICSTMYVYGDKEPVGVNVPIGRPLNNTQIYLLDKYNKPVPIGIAGELCISGDGLARGYINKPELTKEKFVDNPFIEGKKMYKTGDLAKWLPDGNIMFIGRVDHQVKIRGHRIELGEIENVLLKNKNIRKAVVLAKEDESGRKYLCGYLVANNEESFNQIREFISQELPDYMIPTYYTYVDEIPLTANGKIDKKALPEPQINLEESEDYQAPRNKREEKLVEIWKGILKLDKVGINSNFFEIGGDSLKLTSLATKIHKIFNVEVSVAYIFKNPTIKSIANYISNQEENIYSSIKPINKQKYYPVSSAQHRVYSFQQYDKENTAYNMPTGMIIEGELDKNRLTKAFEKLIKRHESLRTSFILDEEGPVQQINEKVAFEIYDYQSKEHGMDNIIEDFIKPFDLTKAPLLRVGLIKTEENKHLLLTDMHHIISDGISIGILTKEFTQLYEDKELDDMKIHYKDFAVWQNKMLESEEFIKQEEYWLSKFQGEIPILNMPTDLERPEINTNEGDSISFEVNEELTKKLRKLGDNAKSTMYMILLSAYYILLQKYSGQEDIVIGSPIAGRPHDDLQNVIGMFVNTLALRNYPHGEKTVKEFIKELKETSLEAYENQDYQFNKLVEKLDIKKDMSKNPLIDVVFTMQNIDMAEGQVDNLKISSYQIENKTTKFDLTLYAFEGEETIKFTLEYYSEIFYMDTIQKLADDYIDILGQIAENTDAKIENIILDDGLQLSEAVEEEDVDFSF